MLPFHWPDGRVPVLLSAHADELVGADAQALLTYLDLNPVPTVADVAGQLLATRRVRRHRAVIRAAERDELVDGLQAVTAGVEHPLVARSGDTATARIAFVFPGQGNQWPGMGAQAYRDLPVYRIEADACAAAFGAAGAPSPLRYLTDSSTSSKGTGFSEIEIEGAQFVHAVALAHVWRSYGVVADLTVGHSLGEVGAAYVAGTITLPDAVAVVAARAGVVDRLPGRYAVAVLGISAEAADEVIASTPGWLELAVVNASSAVAVAGDHDAIADAVQRVRARGDFAREITVGFPVHTSILEPLRDDLLATLPRSEFVDAPVQFIGGATGRVVSPRTPFAQYWYGNLRNMVRFDRAFDTALGCGARTFIEMSAHPALLFAMSDVLGDTPAVLVGSGRRDEEFTTALSGNLAAAAISDPAFSWRAALAPGPSLRGFPNAPMRDTTLWATPDPLPSTPGLTVAQEDWQRIPLPSAGSPPGVRGVPTRISVLDLGGRGPLAGPLCAALGGHAAAVHTDPPDAEILIVIAPSIDTADTTAAVAELTALVDSGMLDYPKVIGPECRDVWLVTVAGEQVRAGESMAVLALPGPAAVAAMHRSLGFEHPDQTFHHLDLAAADLTAAQASLVLDTALRGSGELALRDTAGASVLYQRSLSDAPVAPVLTLDSGILDNVVITGGGGAIGLAHARYFAERGAKRIVLLSRRSAEPAALAALAALTGPDGTEVLAPSCDITDRDQLGDIAAEFGDSGATLLIHAAGTATFAAGDQLDARAVADTFGAKVTGLTLMTELWPLQPQARILLCSSVSGVWGGQGHAAYSAANRMLDVLAAQLRQRGRRCVAMRWGLWQGPDQGKAIVDATETARIERSGLRPMAVDLAIEASLHDYGVDPIVLAGDAHRLRIFFDNTGPVRPESAGWPMGTADAVSAELAAVLSTEAGTIPLDESLFDLGVDSLLALDLRKRLKRVLGRTVPLATLLGGITGTELVAELDTACEQRTDLLQSGRFE